MTPASWDLLIATGRVPLQRRDGDGNDDMMMIVRLVMVLVSQVMIR